MHKSIHPRANFEFFISTFILVRGRRCACTWHPRYRLAATLKASHLQKARLRADWPRLHFLIESRSFFSLNSVSSSSGKSSGALLYNSRAAIFFFFSWRYLNNCIAGCFFLCWRIVLCNVWVGFGRLIRGRCWGNARLFEEALFSTHRRVLWTGDWWLIISPVTPMFLTLESRILPEKNDDFFLPNWAPKTETTRLML
jgi:hypothetical protein